MFYTYKNNEECETMIYPDADIRRNIDRAIKCMDPKDSTSYALIAISQIMYNMRNNTK